MTVGGRKLNVYFVNRSELAAGRKPVIATQ